MWEVWQSALALAGCMMVLVGWFRQLPWPNVLALAVLGGAAFWLLRLVGHAGGGWWGEPLIALGQFLAARAVARGVLIRWSHTSAYGLWLIFLCACLMATLSALPFSWPGPALAAAGIHFLFCVLLQVVLVPWFLRKSPAPAPLDWPGPLAWLIFVAAQPGAGRQAGLEIAARLLLALPVFIWAKTFYRTGGLRP